MGMWVARAGWTLQTAGVAVLAAPWAYLLVTSIAPATALPAVSFSTLEHTIGLTSVFGVSAVLGGAWLASGLPAARYGRSRTEPVLRYQTVAMAVLVLGLVIVFGALWFNSTCERPCVGGGGVQDPSPSSEANVPCGAPCAVQIGQAQVWPVQLIAVGLAAVVAGLGASVVTEVVFLSRSMRYAV